MNPNPANFSPRDAIEEEASTWLARRDRGFTGPEQDLYLQWLREDPRRGEAVTKLEKTWALLDNLATWAPAHSSVPNPDLLAQPSRGRRLPWKSGLLLAAAAAVALAFLAPWSRPPAVAPVQGVRVIPEPERLRLADGTVVDLDHGGKIEADFTPAERRVRLVRGEAHFTVTKNPARPFIVEAGNVSVRAVGTAFDVRRDPSAVAVLVTEGKVQLERPVSAGVEPAKIPLVAGERAIVETAPAAPAPRVTALTRDEIEAALNWQGVRLEFRELRLSEVVAEFNLRNETQLAVGDAGIGDLRVEGNFRADNVDGFVRLLEATFNLKAERQGDGPTVLRRAR